MDVESPKLNIVNCSTCRVIKDVGLGFFFAVFNPVFLNFYPCYKNIPYVKQDLPSRLNYNYGFRVIPSKEPVLSRGIKVFKFAALLLYLIGL